MNQLFKTPKDYVHGISLLHNPKKNHGTAFTAEQRREYGLEGLLPHAVESLERQAERVLQHIVVDRRRDGEGILALHGVGDHKRDRRWAMNITAKLSTQCSFAAILLVATSAAHAQQQAAQQPVCGPMTQQASLPEFVRVRRGTISATYTVDTPYKTIQIGDPKVVDVLAITDRSFNLHAQANGITNVILFDEQGVAVKSVTVLVEDSQDPAVHTVKIFNLPGQLSGSSHYECSATGCQYRGASEIQRVPKEVIEYRGLPEGQGYSPSLRR